MEDRLIRIEGRLISIETTLAKQSAHLEDHLRRTSVVEDALPPLITHVRRVEGGAKILVIFGTFFASTLAFLKSFFN